MKASGGYPFNRDTSQYVPGLQMEIDLVHVAQRLAIVGACSGFIGAALWQMLVGSLHVLAHRLHARAARRKRINAARSRELI